MHDGREADVARSTSALLIAERDALKHKKGLNLSYPDLRLLEQLGVISVAADQISDELLMQLNPMNGREEATIDFSVRALAIRWQCSPTLIRTMIAEGELRSTRRGKLIRISGTVVEKIEARVKRYRESARSSAIASELGQSEGPKDQMGRMTAKGA